VTKISTEDVGKT